MADSKTEQRLAELEKELATLRKKVDSLTNPIPWWERIAGTFAGDPAYKQAMKLGKQFRRSKEANGS
ncbi:MAG: hypothetical protein SH868_13560 [Bythopirellula sp.]|nr:hypothetical protein [Bythopirellula sp.]